jgi:hypothetical protein
MVTRTIIAKADVPNVSPYIPDITVLKLDSPVPAGVQVYPILDGVEDPATVSALPNAPYFMTDQNRKTYLHLISSSNNTTIYGKQHDVYPNMSKSFVSGDSGNPGFIYVNGKMILMTTHTFAGYGAGPFYGSASIIPELVKVIQSLK